MRQPGLFMADWKIVRIITGFMEMCGEKYFIKKDNFTCAYRHRILSTSVDRHFFKATPFLLF